MRKLTYLALLLPSAAAWAIDLQPGDLQVPPSGTRMIQLAYQDSDRGDMYVRGRKMPGEPKVTLSQTQLRLGATFDLGGMPAFSYLQQPVGSLHPGGTLASLPGASGFGDTTMLLAVWPYANHASQTYFAVGGYLTLPTGDYQAGRVLNMGSNRVSTALQVGLQTAVLRNLHWMGAVDGMRSGTNKEFGPLRREQDQEVLYTAQTGLRYDINATFALAATYFYTWGGETRVAGVAQNDRTQLERYQLTATANSPVGKLSLQYGGDFRTENGLLEDRRWVVRLTRFF